MNKLIEHNLQIYNDFSNLIENDNKVKLQKNNNKNYFTLSINDINYCIASYYYNNIIRIDIIGKDVYNFYRILEVFDNIDEIFNYFYKIKCEYYYELNEPFNSENQSELQDNNKESENKKNYYKYNNEVKYEYQNKNNFKYFNKNKNRNKNRNYKIN
jgi:hypothetical protein